MTSAAQIAENRRTLAEIRSHMIPPPQDDEAHARVTIVLEGTRPTSFRVTIEEAERSTSTS